MHSQSQGPESCTEGTRGFVSVERLISIALNAAEILRFNEIASTPASGHQLMTRSNPFA
jgi:hypothetical protein